MDDSSIKDLIRRFVDAWNRRDWPRFASCFSAGADYVTGGAVRWSGRDLIGREMEELMRTGGTGGTAIISHQRIRRLGHDVAVVHLVWRLVDEDLPEASRLLPRNGITLLVQAARDGAWLIEVAQNTDELPT